jgi:cytochrome c peroxidase
MLVPLEGSAPVELGMGGREDELLSRLSADAGYMVDFQAAFPDESAPVALTNVMKAIASFERTLISGDAPVDRARRGEPEAMSASARRGEALFQSERLGCASCHGGLGYSSAFFLPPGASVLDGFRHNGLKAAYPANNAGLAALNPLPENNGRFRVPSLRNVALTAPYMHDGSLPTLEAVVAHYARGGAGHPYQDPRVKGFTLTETEAADMVAFLHALTDETFVQDPRFAAPPAR